ncbi:MAG: FliI/YscN family ATPase [Phycisphaerae bacterium]|nr:FliI/YscN family ATPase [Phycisphaerae bacterium]
MVHCSMPMKISGTITSLTGLTVEVRDFAAPVGALCQITTRNGDTIKAELIGFRGEMSVMMTLEEMTGISVGDKVICLKPHTEVPVGPELLGRVIDGQGHPIDDKGPLMCQVRRATEAETLKPLQRGRIDTPISTGVRAVDSVLTCGCGQRMGIFAGPGVGKSVLLGMIARYTSADVNVIGLIGERGREVREFIERDLGPEGMAKSIVVVSTSDEPAPLRVKAGFVATTIAEYFRDQGKDVLLLMDSATRIAMAQRQIGLAMGEPPATKGYTPSVFAILPKLLERSGKSLKGSITGFYTVLVEGDDLTEPIADAMRSILDGHLALSRKLANRGHYPAVDVLESISRVMPEVTDENQRQAARMVTRLMAIYRDIEDLVNIGAYAPGTNIEYDLAVQSKNLIDDFLRQQISESVNFNQAKEALTQLDAAIMELSLTIQGRQADTASMNRQNTNGPSASPVNAGGMR